MVAPRAIRDLIRCSACTGCGPSSNYDTQSKPQEGAGLAHQSRRRARDFGKSPRNFMPGSEPVWGNGLGQRLDTTFLRARAACFPRFRRPIVGTKPVIQNSHPVGGKQQATFAGYFDRLDSFIEAIRHARTSITSLYKPSTFHRIEAVRRRASSNYNASRYTTGLAPRQRLEEGAAPRFGPAITTRGGRRPQHANYVRTTRTVRRPHRITTRVVTPRG